jgi:DNA-binding LacI/PurR family transcriptional regulator
MAKIVGKNVLKRGKCFRFHINEPAAVALAVDRLAGAGHQTVGIHAWQQAEWSRRRAERIARYGLQLSPPIMTVRAAEPENDWVGGTSMQNFISTMTSRSRRAKKSAEQTRIGPSLRRTLLENAASLTALLKQERVTALIAPNDHCACQYSLWLQAMNVQIPRDLSLISFDNIPRSSLYPVSTVDFGFERLGYFAAHVFIGDIRVPSDTNGNVPGIGTLIDRGSIGKPSNPGRLGKLLE